MKSAVPDPSLLRHLTYEKPSSMTRSILWMVCWLMLGTGSFADEATKDVATTKAEGYPLVPVGVATIDITPSYPTRMSGYGGRVKEHESVAMPIHAKALVIGGPWSAPARRSPPSSAGQDSQATSGSVVKGEREPSLTTKVAGDSKPQLRDPMEGSVKPEHSKEMPLTVIVSVETCGRWTSRS